MRPITKNPFPQPATDILNKSNTSTKNKIPEIVVLTSYPPRECGIATYSKDLVKVLMNKFGDSFTLTVCPLESERDEHVYTDDVKYSINADHKLDFLKVVRKINSNSNVGLVVVQHEFGLFKNNESAFIEFLDYVDKPIALTFHTVLPNPNKDLRSKIQQIASYCDALIVMTQTSADILMKQYGISSKKISVISHGTHLVHYADKNCLKEKYGLGGRKVLSTFGLLGPGKSIETTLDALPGIVSACPETMFLIIGRTHPSLIKEEGERYRDFLEKKIVLLGIGSNVRFVNQFVPLENLLEYLQLTDIYLFTSKDPNQAVSGTFSYALSCGCPVISTPIPHALEVLQNQAGLVFDFENSEQLKENVINVLENEDLRRLMSKNGLHTSARSAWENAAIAHAKVFETIGNNSIKLKYRKPPITLKHLKKMTTDLGIIQFSKINHPDIESGYTLDDNARALITFCQYYKTTKDEIALEYIKTYFNFIFKCYRHDGKFLNYVNKNCQFTDQNSTVNLEDACGRAIWAVGYLLSISSALPEEYQWIQEKARFLFDECLKKVRDIDSPRGMAFVIKGLYYYSQGQHATGNNDLVIHFADRLSALYKQEADDNWRWFEGYLTYGNSVLPHALLMAYVMTLNPEYRKIATVSFDYLTSKIFMGDSIRVISNQNWLRKNDTFDQAFKGGEQPIDVAYTILALRLFHKVFPNLGYDKKMEGAFNWFLGDNSLHQTMYNPCTGGCYDGLELTNVNLNQGAESTLSYLMARLAFEESTAH